MTTEKMIIKIRCKYYGRVEAQQKDEI